MYIPLVHSQGMRAVPHKKWAFFIYSGLMTASTTILGELRTNDNQQEADGTAAGVDISIWDHPFFSAATARTQGKGCIAKQTILWHII